MGPRAGWRRGCKANLKEIPNQMADISALTTAFETAKNAAETAVQAVNT